MPQSGTCLVRPCTQHGLFFKRLDRHLKRVHPGITMKELQTYPPANVKERSIRQMSPADRHIRRPCRVPGCRYYNIPVSRLSDHLRRRHALSIKEHEGIHGEETSNNANCDETEPPSIPPVPVDIVHTLPGACHFREYEEFDPSLSSTACQVNKDNYKP